MKILLPILFILCGVASAEDLTCLSDKERASSSLYSHLQQEAYVALDKRLNDLKALTRPQDIRAYQKDMREFFITSLGGFPERSPLNSRTVGIIQADGYRIEKVIYESQPRHYVTAVFPISFQMPS